MASLMTSLDVENETQKRQIQELEQFVMLLSSALMQEGNFSMGQAGSGQHGGKHGGVSNEAHLIKQFASQFNLTLNVDNIDKQRGSKEKELSLQEKITQALGRLDLLLKENFELKREIVFERKKYVDLHNAYQDLRNNIQEGQDATSPRGTLQSGQQTNGPHGNQLMQGGLIGQ